MTLPFPKEKRKFAIETEGLTKIYRLPRHLLDCLRERSFASSSLTALDQVSLQIKPGEIFVLLGPNGAGKTTLVKILSTLLLPESGKARIFGYDLLTEARKIKPLINLVIGEERSFYWRLTGRQNLQFFSALHNLSGREMRLRIDELTEKFELRDLDKRFDLYSTGAKQRLALARSFLKKESLLVFMDEPTRGLDPGTKTHLHQLIRKMARETGLTFLITTHDTREAEILADQIAILDHGRLSLCGAAKEFYKSGLTPGESLDELFFKITGRVFNVS